MTNEQWQEVERLYHLTLEKQPKERAAFLVHACAGNDVLRREVESLLAYEDQAQDFIESPAIEVAARAMSADQSATAAVGDTIKQYRIVSKIGAGGMGEVYLAEDTSLRRKVALKFLPLTLTKDKSQLHRFEKEARAVAALSHPNVCTIHEVIQTEDNCHCIVMEYVDGMTLRQRMAHERLTVNEALNIASQIAEVLASAHASGIVHRDIKPENVMLRRDGYIKVLDFGLAKLVAGPSEPANSQAETRPVDPKTLPGVVLGTVAYMSPEQARGLPVDARTDIWSLGVVLYEMIAGRKPFEGSTPTDVIISIVSRDPEPLTKSAPEAAALEPIVMKALAKDRAARYQNAESFLNDLKNPKPAREAGTDFDHNKKTAIPRQTWAILFSLLALVAIGVLSFTWFTRNPKSSAPPRAGIQSLAVLPISNLSGDASQDYFADGMTETLIAGLSKAAALRVTSRTSVMQFKGSPKPLPEIASELGVDAIVEGSVQRSGDTMQFNVRLIDAATERQLWSGQYKRELRDVLMVQNEIATAVAQAIQIKLTPQEQSRLAKARPINPQAYDDYLRGRYYLNLQNKADNKTAIEALNNAVTIDPSFASAWAELAQAYVWRLFLFAPDEKNLNVKAYVAVEKALALDPDLPEAYLARGRLLWTPSNQFPHDKAIQEYRHALALNPSLDEARNQLAVVLNHVGLLDEAHEELRKALAANPANNLARFRVGETLLFEGKNEEALNALRSVPPDANPSLIGHQIVLALFNLGRKEEAAATVEKFLKDYPEDNRGLFTSLQAILAASDGQQRLAEEKIQSAIERGKGFGHFHHTAYHIALAYAIMNKQDEAINWLESTANGGFPCYVLFATDHNLDNLRQNPRFQAFLEKLKQQWEHYKTLPDKDTSD